MNGFWVFITIVFVCTFFFTRQTRCMLEYLAPIVKCAWSKDWFRALTCIVVGGAFGWFGAWGSERYKGTWVEDPITATAFVGVICAIIGVIANLREYLDS